MLCPEKAGGYRDNKGNNGPPEHSSTSYCFGLLLSTSGAVSGIFGRGVKVVIGHAPNTPTGFRYSWLGYRHQL